MKKILTALIIILLSLNTLVFANSTDIENISGDKFAEITGFPVNLPEGWIFDKHSERSYTIYPDPRFLSDTIFIIELTNSTKKFLTPLETKTNILNDPDFWTPEKNFLFEHKYTIDHPLVAKDDSFSPVGVVFYEKRPSRNSITGQRNVYQSLDIIKYNNKLYAFMTYSKMGYTRKQVAEVRKNLLEALFKSPLINFKS